MSAILHLSVTGYEAGRRLCLATDDRSVHAAYAPLDSAQFRALCCPECLRLWAEMAYDPDDAMPNWVALMRLAYRPPPQA